MRSDVVPGGTFPDYALPGHTGTVRKPGLIVHSIYNGYWFLKRVA